MSKHIIKRLAALGCAAAMMSSLTGCGENTTWGAEADGVRIPAGVFIYYLDNANYEASTKFSQQNAGSDISEEAAAIMAPEMTYSSDIEGKPAKQWIYDKATDSMQEYAVIEAKFAQYGLALTDNDTKSVSNYVDQMWDYMGDSYTEKGISESSFRSVMLNSVKNSKLFEALYSEGGAFGVADSEIKSYLDENYAMINYIHVEYKDGEGNILKSDGKAERRKMLESYIERYKNGEDFDKLNAEYVTYYDNLVAEAEAKNAENAENAENGENTAQVDTSAAQADMTGDSESLTGDETAEETAAPSETLAPEEDGAEETTAPTETTTAAPETAAPADTTVSADALPVITDVKEVTSNQTVLEKSDGTLPCKEVAERVFGGMNKGELEIIETADGDNCYLVLKMDIIETDEYFLAAKTSLLYEMRQDDFDAKVEEWKAALNFVKNQEAYDRYDPEKLFKA